MKGRKLAKIPTIRRLLVEDFPQQKSWIGRLFEPVNTFLITVINAMNNQLTIHENMLAQTDRVRIRTNAYYTDGASGPTSVDASFVDADVNTGTDEITMTAHPFSTGDLVQLTTTGVLPGGLSLNTNYWVIRIDANTIQLAASLADSFAGTFVDITSAAGGGTHTATEWVQQPAYVGLTEVAKFSIRFKGFPLFCVLGACVEVAGNQVIIRQATSIDWSFNDGLVTINAVAGLEPGKQYDLVIYTSGG